MCYGWDRGEYGGTNHGLVVVILCKREVDKGLFLALPDYRTVQSGLCSLGKP